MTRWDLSQEHKIGLNPLMRYNLVTEQRMKTTGTSAETEKRHLKNAMNIHDKILKKTPNKPRSRTEFPQLDKGHLRKTDSYHHILLVKDSPLPPQD